MSEPTQPTALHGSVTLAGVWLVPLFFGGGYAKHPSATETVLLTTAVLAKISSQT